jgi:hypothetical protein
MIGVFVGFSRIFLLGILMFKGLTARRLYKSFGVKGLISIMVKTSSSYLTENSLLTSGTAVSDIYGSHQPPATRHQPPATLCLSPN